jgi:hypothetical protein
MGGGGGNKKSWKLRMDHIGDVGLMVSVLASNLVVVDGGFDPQ